MVDPQDVRDMGPNGRLALDAWKAAQDENARLRRGLELAREWLQGWGSAEPYLDRIEALLEQGGAPAAREPHKLEVGGSIPPPATNLAAALKAFAAQPYLWPPTPEEAFEAGWHARGADQPEAKP